MVSARKKAYMYFYNKRPEVKARKAEYMRRIRAEKDAEAARNLVSHLLSLGYEDLAFEYAQERCPEMLVAIKTKPRHKIKQIHT